MRLLFVVLLLLQTSTPIPVEQEPRHKIVYADARMRVLDVSIPPGDTTLEHMHYHDLATVCLECAPTRSKPQAGEFGDVRSRAVATSQATEYTAKPSAHTVVNLSKTEKYHLLAVENLNIGGSPGGAARGLKPTSETAAFRFYEYSLQPGEMAPPHTHAAPAVSITVESRTWKVVPTGQPHTVIGASAPTRIVEIEVK